MEQCVLLYVSFDGLALRHHGRSTWLNRICFSLIEGTCWEKCSSDRATIVSNKKPSNCASLPTTWPKQIHILATNLTLSGAAAILLPPLRITMHSKFITHYLTLFSYSVQLCYPTLSAYTNWCYLFTLLSADQNRWRPALWWWRSPATHTRSTAAVPTILTVTLACLTLWVKTPDIPLC